MVGPLLEKQLRKTAPERRVNVLYALSGVAREAHRKFGAKDRYGAVPLCLACRYAMLAT